MVSGKKAIYTYNPKAIPVKYFEPSKPFDKLLVTEQKLLSLDIIQLQPDMIVHPVVTETSQHTSGQRCEVMAVYHDLINIYITWSRIFAPNTIYLNCIDSKDQGVSNVKKVCKPQPGVSDNTQALSDLSS